jgi:putative hydrolase of the HAD superfamily
MEDLTGDAMPLVLVDFDDTLVETAPAFQKAREALFQRLEVEGFPRDQAHGVHHKEVDPELLALHGMGPFRMEPSFRETYLRLCQHHGREPVAEVVEACGALGRDFLGKPRVMEGSLEALDRLSRDFPTAVFSQSAQKDYQMGRIREAGVAQVVGQERILVTERKTPESFLAVLRHFQIQSPGEAIMVGNSIRSDINPALASGAGAILVEPYEMWEYDNVEPVSLGFSRFGSFPEAVAFLLDGNSRPPFATPS